jgi:hypothetical protein
MGQLERGKEGAIFDASTSVIPIRSKEQEGATVRAPFRLLEGGNGVSVDTIECLEILLKEAREGKVIGVCYAAMHKQRRFTVHSCGEAHRNPTFARGMVASLDDQLSARVRTGNS